jgi:hypothetical protein
MVAAFTLSRTQQTTHIRCRSAAQIASTKTRPDPFDQLLEMIPPPTNRHRVHAHDKVSRRSIMLHAATIIGKKACATVVLGSVSKLIMLPASGIVE